jgi:hypothetical protein
MSATRHAVRGPSRGLPRSAGCRGTCAPCWSGTRLLLLLGSLAAWFMQPLVPSSATAQPACMCALLVLRVPPGSDTALGRGGGVASPGCTRVLSPTANGRHLHACAHGVVCWRWQSAVGVEAGRHACRASCSLAGGACAEVALSAALSCAVGVCASACIACGRHPLFRPSEGIMRGSRSSCVYGLGWVAVDSRNMSHQLWRFVSRL